MRSPILAATLVHGNRVRSFEVRPGPVAGWDACEHEDDCLIRKQGYTDWHRVEQTIARFERAITELREQGWGGVTCDG
jgi:hypothetical protein